MTTARVLPALVALSLVLASTAGAQVPSLVNYQGRLVDGTNLYNGTVALTLSVYNSESDPFMLLCSDTGQVTIVDGLYSTFIGDGLASGDMSWIGQSDSKWIEVVINTVTMRPRERIVSVPYAFLSGGVTNSAITTMMIADGAILGSHISDGTIGFDDIGENSATNGQIMKWNGSDWVAANDLTSGGGALASYAESGTFSPSPQALGIESIAQGRGTRAEGDNSVVGGGFSNTVGYGAHYAVIGGGEQNAIGDTAYDSTIAGGYRGTIFAASRYSSIGGGFLNEIYGGASYATIAGGYQNDIRDDADYGFVGGGFGNEIGTNAFHAAVVGGYRNRIDAYATNAFIGGGLYNRIDEGARDAAIVGGYSNTVADGNRASAIGGGQENRIGEHAQFSAIGGGAGNTMENGPSYAVIGGGVVNKMDGSGDYGVIGGGQGNVLETNASAAVIGGGTGNTTGPDADYSVIGGGYHNSLDADADYAVVGGGLSNFVGGQYAVVPGGSDNIATGAYSFAAGSRAAAAHPNTFVWSDGSGDDRFTSSNANTFIVRATNGVGINTADPRANLHVVGDTSQASLKVSPSSAYDLGHGGANTPGTANLVLGPYLNDAQAVYLRVHTNGSFLIRNPYYELFYGEGGNVGILTTNIRLDYALSVGGKIRCEGVTVETGWADFVFDPAYDLPTLDEVEAGIRERGTLPGMPTEAEVSRDGVELGGMQVKLLQKIEELTLYTIAQEKRIAELERRIEAMTEGARP